MTSRGTKGSSSSSLAAIIVDFETRMMPFDSTDMDMDGGLEQSSLGSVSSADLWREAMVMDTIISFDEEDGQQDFFESSMLQQSSNQNDDNDANPADYFNNAFDRAIDQACELVLSDFQGPEAANDVRVFGPLGYTAPHPQALHVVRSNIFEDGFFEEEEEQNDTSQFDGMFWQIHRNPVSAGCDSSVYAVSDDEGDWNDDDEDEDSVSL